MSREETQHERAADRFQFRLLTLLLAVTTIAAVLALCHYFGWFALALVAVGVFSFVLGPALIADMLVLAIDATARRLSRSGWPRRPHH